MGEFIFDSQKSPDENIEAFFTYLESIDKEFAQLLRQSIGDMPHSDAPDSERNQARRSINSKIATYLDQKI